MGWTFMGLILSHCLMLYSVALVKKRWLCFVAGLATLASIKLEPYNSWQVRLMHSLLMPSSPNLLSCSGVNALSGGM